MRRNLKKVVLLLALCMLLTACGQTVPVATEPVATGEQQTEEATSETMEETVAEETSIEDASEELATAEVETEEVTTEEATTEEVTTEEVTTEEAGTEETTVAEEETTTEEDDKTAKSKEESAEEVKEKKPIVVTRLEEPKTLYATIALNVRRGPSTDYERAGSLAMAEDVLVLGQADTGWYFFMRNGEPVYASGKYLSETKPELPPPAPPTPQPNSGQTAVAPAGVIMVGDSRCVQMQEAVGGGGCSWVCENSKEIKWFQEKAIPRIDPSVGRGTKVVINMGVNDPEHYLKYVEVVNAKAAEWVGRGAKVYFVSVNPVWENPYTTQEQVDMFNANVPGMLSNVRWIDTSSWLVANGYRLVDGLHYDGPTYVNIFNLIMGSL